jgi:hypothetical protein
MLQGQRIVTFTALCIFGMVGLSRTARAQFLPVALSGTVFNDLNGDGSSNGSTDPGLGGWTVDLLDGGGAIIASATTPANGSYSFPNVGQGSFTVQEEPQAGWIQTFPAPPGTYSLTTVSGQDVTGLDFGNFELVSVSGNIYNDLNGNGSQDGGEPGLGGWTAELRDNLNNLIATLNTDPNGNFTLPNLGPGSYILDEVVQAGWTQTQPVSPNFYTFTTTSGVNVVGGVFGNQTSVPEPGGIGLLLGAAVPIGLLVRRRK